MPRVRMHGFTLIEVVMSLFVIGVVIVLSGALIRIAPLSRHTKDEDIALSIASNEVESLRSGGYAAVPGSGNFTDPLLASIPSGSGALVVSNFNTNTKQVAVTVSWQEKDTSTTSSLTLSTLITKVGGLK